ncbi:LptE family protein [Pedobacter sp. JCM 36344]|uniref:LptE family protein n=1 Tax=Pedobacter sp. JCM 36344 TaxID=3374280 RepID=UPI00397A38A7
MRNLYIVILFFMISGCKVSLDGASIPPGMKTVNVTVFENNAPLVVSTLSTQLTEDFKTRIRNQTKLSLTNNEPEATFSGNITGYDIRPVALQDNGNRQALAGANRLTIRVNVKYVNNLDPKKSFEEAFERFKEFKLAGNLQAQEPALIKDVTAQLIEDIFNRAFAQW